MTSNFLGQGADWRLGLHPSGGLRARTDDGFIIPGWTSASGLKVLAYNFNIGGDGVSYYHYTTSGGHVKEGPNAQTGVISAGTGRLFLGARNAAAAEDYTGIIYSIAAWEGAYASDAEVEAVMEKVATRFSV